MDGQTRLEDIVIGILEEEQETNRSLGALGKPVWVVAIITSRNEGPIAPTLYYNLPGRGKSLYIDL